MKEVIEQIDTVLGNASITWQTDEILFNKMADFISNLNPEILDDYEIEKAMEIMEELSVEGEDEYEEEVTEVRIAKKTGIDKKKYSKRYYRKNRAKIIRKKERFKKSAEGRKRKRFVSTHKTTNLTATGRKKVRYHNTTGSNGVTK